MSMCKCFLYTYNLHIKLNLGCRQLLLIKKLLAQISGVFYKKHFIVVSTELAKYFFVHGYFFIGMWNMQVMTTPSMLNNAASGCSKISLYQLLAHKRCLLNLNTYYGDGKIPRGIAIESVPIYRVKVGWTFDVERHAF